MASIGSFKKVGNEFQGQIVTLSVQAKAVRIAPETNRANGNAPSHRVFVGKAEIGALSARLVKALERGPRLNLGQARRSLLHPADLVEPVRCGKRLRLLADLVTQPKG